MTDDVGTIKIMKVDLNLNVTPFHNNISKNKSKKNNMKKFLIMFFVVLAQVCAGQPSITWQRLYNGELFDASDNGRGLCVTTNGNIYLTGFELSLLGDRATVLKLQPNGDVIWVKHFNNIRGTFIVSTNDGGCIVTGDANYVYTMKLDRDGNTVWYKSYGSFGTRSTDIIRTSDNGYVICGFQTSVSPRPAYIVKLDSLGNQKWQKYFYAGDIKYFNSISEKEDGNLVLSGGKVECEFCNGHPILLELNSIGDSLWERSYNLFAEFKKIYSNEKEYLIGGTILDSPYVFQNAFIMRTSLSGDITFKKNIDYSNYEDLKDMRIINNNKYVLACDTDTLDRLNAGVYIIDSIGNTIHRKIFYVTDYSLFFSILTLYNGDIVFSGTVETNLPQRRDIYAVRTDSTLLAKPLGIKEEINNFPEDFRLFQNYPNPFNPVTKIRYNIFGKDIFKIIVHNVLGKIVGNYVLTKQGSNEILFNGSNLPSGIYFYSLSKNNITIQTKKMLLVQ